MLDQNCLQWMDTYLTSYCTYFGMFYDKCQKSHLSRQDTKEIVIVVNCTWRSEGIVQGTCFGRKPRQSKHFHE